MYSQREIGKISYTNLLTREQEDVNKSSYRILESSKNYSSEV